MRYRADLDGLRAIAVTAVILDHLGVPGVRGGYVGVDVFFVISGYLITSMIAPAARARRFSIVDFYQRRVRRIAPAFFAMTVASSVAAWFLMPPTDLARYGASVTATSTFSSNVLFWRQEGYFDIAAHGKPMLHTWSLAVEEQFYIVYPLLLAALFRWWPRRVGPWLIALTAASLAACVWTTAAAPRLAFYLMPLRGWELLAGALLALDLVPPATRAWQRQLAATAGLGAIVGAIVGFSSATAFPGVAALIPVAGAALLIYAHAGDDAPATAVGRLLRARPMVFVGAISYSLYLWHWPALVFARSWIGALTPAHLAAVALATLALAVLSWRFVEQPVRRPSTWATRRALFGGLAAATAITISFGVATSATHGWPGRVSAEVRALDHAAADYNHDRPRCHGYDRRPIAYDDKCVYGRAGVAPSVALWGDSMAAELAVALGREADARGRGLLYISYSSCPPAKDLAFADRPGCRAHDREVLARLAASATITTVVLVAQYRRYERLLGPRFVASFGEVATTLTAAGKRVLVVYPIPTPPGRVPTLLARAAMRGQAPTTIAIARAAYDAENRATIAALDQLVAQPGIDAIRIADRLCDATRCAVYADGRVLYFDDRHLSVTGAAFVMPLFRAAVE
ncbi:MAG: acyltransferase [Myxococcales bacterium]|nr:acyltransferase [Myxococcales bacterium]